MTDPEHKIQIKLPHELQTDLKRVYASLPLRQAVIPSHINYSSLNSIEKSGYFKMLDNEELRRMGSELVIRQIGLLANLLDVSYITPSLKVTITEEFENNFRYGIDKENPSYIFKIIGLTKDNPQAEGIFSINKDVRKKIERQYYAYLQDHLENLIEVDEKDEESWTDEIDLAREEIRVFKLQFLAIYGEDVASD